MKTVTYRGAVRFCIPDHWVEEDEPCVQGIFYENGPNTGTLRVSVFDFFGRNGSSLESVMENKPSEALGNGALLVFQTISEKERGTELLLFRYEIFLPIDEDLVRMVAFTYAIRADQRGDSKTIAELGMIDRGARTLQIAVDRHLRLDDPRQH